MHHARDLLAQTPWMVSYDASGDMLCRAPSSSQTCAGTPTGAKFTYDTEGHLTAWQDKQTSPTSTTAYLYDGEGQRIQQQVTSGGTTKSVCVGGLVEARTVTGGPGGGNVDYYSANGSISALATNPEGGPILRLHLDP